VQRLVELELEPEPETRTQLLGLSYRLHPVANNKSIDICLLVMTWMENSDDPPLVEACKNFWAAYQDALVSISKSVNDGKAYSGLSVWCPRLGDQVAVSQYYKNLRFIKTRNYFITRVSLQTILREIDHMVIGETLEVKKASLSSIREDRSFDLNAVDNQDPNPSTEVVGVAVSEPDDVQGSGNTSPDYEVTSDGRVFVRAERSGTGQRRIYTVTFKAEDASGNASFASADVVVPHDKGKGKK